MTYTFEQLKEDVRKEAEALKVHATKEEREKLSIALLNPNLPETCNYGLMTGCCTSPRAHELIAKCCVRLINNDQFDHEVINSLGWTDTHDPIAENELADIRFSNEVRTDLKYISPMEAYIMIEKAKNANLITFLRGESDDLDL